MIRHQLRDFFADLSHSISNSLNPYIAVMTPTVTYAVQREFNDSC